MFEKIQAMISEQMNLSIADIKMESTFVEDLGADSLDIMEFIVKLEDEFGVEMSDEDLEKIHCVGDLVNYFSNLK